MFQPISPDIQLHDGHRHFGNLWLSILTNTRLRGRLGPADTMLPVSL